MKNRWKNSVYGRLFFMFLLIMTPIFCIGISIYDWGIRAIQDDIDKSMIAQVSLYLNRLDTEIQRMKLLQFDCISDDDLNTLAFASQSMNNFERNKALLRLQKRMIAIKSSSQYIEDASVSIAGLNLTVSADHGVLKGVIEDAPASVNPRYTTSVSKLLLWEGGLSLNVTYPLSVKDTSTYSYMISIKLMDGAFIQDLKQFNTYPDSVSMIASRVGGFQLASGKEGGTPAGVNELLEQKLQHASTGVFDVKDKADKQNYMAVYATSDYLGLSVARFVPEQAVFSRVHRYQIWLWAFSLVSLVIIALFSISIYNFIHKPLRSMVKAFKHVEMGDLKVHIEHRHNDEFKYLYQRFNAMVGHLNNLIDQVYKQKILMQNAQLKQLQAQINPHFLYNTFFILYSIARAEDYENTMRFLEQLGSYFKFITRNTADDVPLSREVDHARTYTNIQALRFSKRISIDFEELPDRFANVMVPRLIIQPIIENSFKYGLEDKADNGLLKIRFLETDGLLDIEIEDNGNGMNSADMLRLMKTLENRDYEEEATGMVNIHKRLQLKFGDESGLVATGGELGGLKVVIRLKLKGE